MLNKIIKMELLSDLCPASGDGFAGYVDTDVCFDDLGLPYIPSKRLKGCLRECGLDITCVDGSYIPVFKRLFGETGSSAPGALNIDNGKLENYSEIAKSLGSAERSEIAEVYTSVRSRTKMEKGKVVPGTLRTARTLNKGQIYTFPTSLADDTYEFFEMCVYSLRSMGLNRSRGLGEVKCTLEDDNTQLGVRFIIESMGEESGFSYALELLEPVIAAERTGKPQETENYIFGSAILGAFAVKYIENKKIENKKLDRNNAYEDPDFRRIFLDGSVKFTAVMPNVDGQIYYSAPAVLRTDKLKTRLFDESMEVYDDNTDSDHPICKRLGGFILTNPGGEVKALTPGKVAFPHHARPVDRSIAHATETDGKFYTYEALSEGQIFTGSVIGNTDDIRILSNLFTDSDILRIGRSRTAQYGKVKIISSNNAFAENSLDLKNGDLFRIVAVTPVILEDDKGINKVDIDLIRNSLGADYEIVRSVCSETVVSGYYGKWLLPRRQERAIAEGSTIVVKYNGAKTTLKTGFIGKRINEGFGQIHIETIPESTGFTFAEEGRAAPEQRPSALPDVEKLRADKEAVAKGIGYGENCFKTAPPNANLERVLVALKQAKNYHGFAELLDTIKQPKQKIAALCFVTAKDKWYFKTDAKHLETRQVTELLEQCGYDYPTYQKYLNAAAHRIKQQRRSNTENENGGEVK